MNIQNAQQINRSVQAEELAAEGVNATRKGSQSVRKKIALQSLHVRTCQSLCMASDTICFATLFVHDAFCRCNVLWCFNGLRLVLINPCGQAQRSTQLQSQTTHVHDMIRRSGPAYDAAAKYGFACFRLWPCICARAAAKRKLSNCNAIIDIIRINSPFLLGGWRSRAASPQGGVAWLIAVCVWCLSSLN